MNVYELNKKFSQCCCGMEHKCPVETVNIGKGAIDDMPKLCKEYQNILLVSDENTFRVCGQKVYQSLKDKIYKNLIIKAQSDVVIPDEEKILEAEECIKEETDLIISVGSGVINDICKYVSYKNGLPYFIVATAPSMDGYASVGAALILDGMKVTINSAPPKGIIADTTVLKDAPIKMLQAGYGDILGKYSCLNDWKLSSFINGEYFCQQVYDYTLDCAEKVKPLAEKIINRDEESIGTLMEALVVVGFLMSYVDSSRPASGSEHHLSHFFEITGILENKKYFPHGIDVIYSAAVTAKIREKMIDSKLCKNEFDEKGWEKEIKRIYSSCADGVINLQKKYNRYKKDDSLIVLKNESEIKRILKEAPSSKEFIELAGSIGLCFDEFLNLYGKEKINDAVLYAKDLKDRYTVLWLYYMYSDHKNLY